MNSGGLAGATRRCGCLNSTPVRTTSWIRAAKRPLVIAGGGVHHSRAEEALRAFAESTGIPVSETQAGRGSLRFDHPCEPGSIRHTGTAVSDDVARAADLIIGVGTRYSDFTTASRTLFANPDVRFVNVNITSLDAHKQAATPVIGDARATLEQLTEVLAGHRVSEDYVQEYRAGAQRWAQVIEQTTRSAAGDERPGQAEVLGVLDEVLDDRHVVTTSASPATPDRTRLRGARRCAGRGGANCRPHGHPSVREHARPPAFPVGRSPN
ncbi:hypothetical protein [Saccharopolyspora pogona]